MAMQNMWWHFRFLFGQTNFLSVRQFFFKLPDRMSDKLSWIFDMSAVVGEKMSGDVFMNIIKEYKT